MSGKVNGRRTEREGCTNGKEENAVRKAKGICRQRSLQCTTTPSITTVKILFAFALLFFTYIGQCHHITIQHWHSWAGMEGNINQIANNNVPSFKGHAKGMANTETNNEWNRIIRPTVRLHQIENTVNTSYTVW